MFLLITPDKIFLKLVIDNKNVVKYTFAYPDLIPGSPYLIPAYVCVPKLRSN